MRRTPVFALVWLLLGSAAAQAAKPPPPSADTDRQIFEMQAFAHCASGNAPDKYELGTDDIFADCQCAAARFVAQRPAGELPVLDPGRTAAALRPLYAACRSERLARSTAAAPVAAAPPVAAPEREVRRDSQRAEDGFDLRQWLDGHPMSRWLWLGVPAVLVLLLLLFGRRRDGRGDLVAPPPAMRRGPDAPP